jgi:sugar phosphate isomerase/epimerase
VRLGAAAGPQTEHHSGVRIGLFTDGLKHLPRREALAWAAEHGITDVEMSVGTWGARTHLDLQALLTDQRSIDDLRRDLDATGIRFSAVNAAGNPLHPEPTARAAAQAAVRGAIELAARLGVDRVVTMAGSPGGRTGGPIGVFGLWSIVNDDEPIWAWQMESEVGPYWRGMSDWMATAAPDVRVCLELHPGVSVWTLETYRALRAYCGDNIGVNLDPSHFWWQGADPIRVIEALGAVVGWCHGKDTTLYPDRILLHGVLDHRYPVDAATAPWHFSAIGDGHDAASWAHLIKALQAVGHDSVISIEHEDPSLAPAECITRSVATLQRALAL